MISAVVLTKNEKKNIVDCLEGLSFCDEILVIDDNSHDRTVEIARKNGAKVMVHPLNDDFSKQRNYGLDKANGDWVLFIDADERVGNNLANEIKQKVAEGKYNAFFVKRIDTIWGKRLKHGETGSKWLLRLGRKDAGKWAGMVHEGWIIQGRVGELNNELDHYPHQSVEEFLKEVNYYTTLRANELFKKGVQVNWYDIILYPKLKFLMNFFFKLGFLDGTPGLIFALMMSFHSFLVRGKLWLLNQKN